MEPSPDGCRACQCAPGITFQLEGDANDYIGKGLSGGTIIVYKPKQAWKRKCLCNARLPFSTRLCNFSKHCCSLSLISSFASAGTGGDSERLRLFRGDLRLPGQHHRGQCSALRRHIWQGPGMRPLFGARKEQCSAEWRHALEGSFRTFIKGFGCVELIVWWGSVFLFGEE